MRVSLKIAAAAVTLAIATAAGYGVGLTQVNQPHMQNALSELQSAKGELQVASTNKSGHRVNALNLVNRAITEVQAGIAAGEGY
jgi:hypothetical protein